MVVLPLPLRERPAKPTLDAPRANRRTPGSPAVTTEAPGPGRRRRRSLRAAPHELHQAQRSTQAHRQAGGGVVRLRAPLRRVVLRGGFRLGHARVCVRAEAPALGGGDGGRARPAGRLVEPCSCGRRAWCDSRRDRRLEVRALRGPLGMPGVLPLHHSPRCRGGEGIEPSRPPAVAPVSSSTG